MIAPDDLVQSIRRGHRARLPDVLCALGYGRTMGLAGHRRDVRWLTPRLDAVHGANWEPFGCLRETLKVLRRKVHQTLQQVTHDFENFEFNTIVSVADGTAERNVQGPRSRRVGTPGMERGSRYLPEDAGAGLPAHRRGTVGSCSASRIRSTPSPGPKWTRLPHRKTRSRSRCRSTARCVIAWSSRRRPAKKRSSQRHWRVKQSGNIWKAGSPKKVIVVQKKLVSIVI